MKVDDGSENRAAILASLTDRGVLYDLIDGIFRWCDEHEVLSEEEDVCLEVCRPGLTEHLRRERGLCVACGRVPATRPNLNGFAGPKGTPLGDVPKSAPDRLRETYPPRWCSACWHAERWKDCSVLQSEDSVQQDRETLL